MSFKFKLPVVTVFFLILVLTPAIFAKTDIRVIKTIRSHFQWINSQTNTQKIELDEGFLDMSPDNGASLIGFYQDNKLYKIIETVGLSFGIMTTEYYFWNKLFFTYHKEQSFKKKYDQDGNFLELDYTHLNLNYQTRHYFHNGKLIRNITKGKPIFQKQDPKQDLQDAKKWKLLLTKKKADLAKNTKIKTLHNKNIWNYSHSKVINQFKRGQN